MCSPTVVTNVTMIASVIKVWVFFAMVTEVTSDFLVTTLIIVTSNTAVPVDTVATMITKVTHVRWLLCVHEHSRSDLCCGHFLFSTNQLKRSFCVLLPAYISLCEFNFL